MKYLFTCALLLTGGLSIAQRQLPLEDMSDFKSQDGNWFVVGAVEMNPDVDIHHVQRATDKKKKKGVLTPQAVTYAAGTGILLNMNDDKRKSNLQTTWEHGDIWLELEVMLPKGSNSGLYLQGRYEVQLFDSWGVKQPKFSDMGGIYRNWEKEPEKIYMGKPPISNPAKAPGLWQKLEILFIAPKFDDAGNKVTNAKFEFVDLNGIRIHNNAEVPKLTGGPIAKEEAAMGPIMIQGDHGPVAIRNFSYKLLGDAPVTLSSLKYKEYKGKFQSAPEYLETVPVNEGASDMLTCEVLENDNNYLLVYEGNVEVGAEDEYTFSLGYTGGGKLTVDGNVLVDRLTMDGRGNLTKSIKLAAGSYPFEIQVVKTAGWHPARLGLSVQGVATHRKNLHSYGSFPDKDNVRAPIFLDTKGCKPTLHRGFADFYAGGVRKRLSHTIAVGEPTGIHYVFDLNTSNIICMWRGDFIDATPMWNNRGNGSFKTRGATEYTFLNQPLAYITGNEVFPETGNKDFKPEGYKIDTETGRPVFLHSYRGLKVETRVTPDEESNYLNVALSVDGTKKDGLFYKIAEGESITQNSNGSYIVDQKRYIKVREGQTTTIRQVDGKSELMIAIDQDEVSYSIIW